jgi:hypothetical protein
LLDHRVVRIDELFLFVVIARLIYSEPRKVVREVSGVLSRRLDSGALLQPSTTSIAPNAVTLAVSVKLAETVGTAPANPNWRIRS